MRRVWDVGARGVVGRLPLVWSLPGVTLVGALSLLALVVASERFPFLLVPRTLLAVVYLLYLPGHLATIALFPRRADLGGIERTALGLGLSLVIVTLQAVLLDQLPAGIHTGSVLAANLATIALLLGAAAWRRDRLAPWDSLRVAAPRFRDSWRRLSGGERRFTVALSALLGVGLLASGALLLAAPSRAATTEFYVLGKEGLAEGLPGEAAPGDVLSVTLGIANHERDAHAYVVEARLTDPWDPEVSSLLAHTEALTLAPGQVREFPLSWQMPAALPAEGQVELILLVDGDAAPYRRLRLWIRALAPSPAP